MPQHRRSSSSVKSPFDLLWIDWREKAERGQRELLYKRNTPAPGAQIDLRLIRCQCVAARTTCLQHVHVRTDTSTKHN